MSSPVTPAVRMQGISKSFEGVTVLQDVSFHVEEGEVHALAGGNGAGKSTLMKILQGVYQQDTGTIEVLGAPLTATTVQNARTAGVGMVFQEFSLTSTLTVAQNIFLGNEPTRAGLIEDGAMREQAAAVLDRMGVAIDPTAEVSTLPTAQWQLTEIAKALSQHARVLIMDEPTAALPKHEVDALFELIGRLKTQGISIVYISHRMDEIYRIADRITILRNGKNLLTSRIRDVTPQEVVSGIAGREIAMLTRRDPSPTGHLPTILDVHDLHAEGVHGATFQLRAGEVLGIAGLMGAGRTELARALFGVNAITDGRVLKDGRPVRLDSPRHAIDAGIALIPEDRRLQGLVLDHSVRENLTLPLLDRLRRRRLIAADKVRQLSNALIDRFSIAVARPDAPAHLLSGGNQQKIVIAKWLGTDPDVLVMDEPTAGVDIGTKSEIVRIVRELAQKGKGIIVISSEYAELIAMCDRYLVMRDGTIVAKLDADEVRTEVDLELAVQGIAT